jgi:hypothetical protein
MRTAGSPPSVETATGPILAIGNVIRYLDTACSTRGKRPNEVTVDTSPPEFARWRTRRYSDYISFTCGGLSYF